MCSVIFFLLFLSHFSVNKSQDLHEGLIQLLSIALSATPMVIKLSTTQPYQKSVFCMVSRYTKLETVNQLDGDQSKDGNPVQRCQVSAVV